VTEPEDREQPDDATPGRRLALPDSLQWSAIGALAVGLVVVLALAILLGRELVRDDQPADAAGTESNRVAGPADAQQGGAGPYCERLITDRAVSALGWKADAAAARQTTGCVLSAGAGRIVLRATPRVEPGPGQTKRATSAFRRACGSLGAGQSTVRRDPGWLDAGRSSCVQVRDGLLGYAQAYVLTRDRQVAHILVTSTDPVPPARLRAGLGRLADAADQAL